MLLNAIERVIFFHLKMHLFFFFLIVELIDSITGVEVL